MASVNAGSPLSILQSSVMSRGSKLRVRVRACVSDHLHVYKSETPFT